MIGSWTGKRADNAFRRCLRNPLFVGKVGAGAFAGLTITANILMSLVIDKFRLFGMETHARMVARSASAQSGQSPAVAPHVALADHLASARPDLPPLSATTSGGASAGWGSTASCHQKYRRK